MKGNLMEPMHPQVGGLADGSHASLQTPEKLCQEDSRGVSEDDLRED